MKGLAINAKYTKSLTNGFVAKSVLFTFEIEYQIKVLRLTQGLIQHTEVSNIKTKRE